MWRKLKEVKELKFGFGLIFLKLIGYKSLIYPKENINGTNLMELMLMMTCKIMMTLGYWNLMILRSTSSELKQWVNHRSQLRNGKNLRNNNWLTKNMPSFNSILVRSLLTWMLVYIWRQVIIMIAKDAYLKDIPTTEASNLIH